MDRFWHRESENRGLEENLRTSTSPKDQARQQWFFWGVVFFEKMCFSGWGCGVSLLCFYVCVGFGLFLVGFCLVINDLFVRVCVCVFWSGFFCFSIFLICVYLAGVYIVGLTSVLRGSKIILCGLRVLLV